MAIGVRTLVLAAVCAASTACAHTSSAPDQLASGPSLPDLGEDMPAATDVAPGSSAKLLSIDKPVGQLCGDADARAVIDRDLPGLTTRPEYIFFKRMSLRQLQAASRGRMSLEALARVASDLDALELHGSSQFVAVNTPLP